MGINDILNRYEQEQDVTVPTPPKPLDIKPTKATASYLDAVERQFDQQFAISVDQGVKADPDKSAKALTLSNKTGIPVDTVERNLGAVEQMNRAMMIRAQRAANTDPVLAAQLTDPTFAKISHDQTENLSLLEKSARVFWSFASGPVSTTVGMGLEGSGYFLESAWRKSIFSKTAGIAGLVLPEPFAAPYRELSKSPGGIETGLKISGKAVRKFSKEYIEPEGGPQGKAEQIAQGLGQAAGQVGLFFVPGGQVVGTGLMLGQGSMMAKERMDMSPIALAAPQSDKDWQILTGGIITGATEFIATKLTMGVPATFALKSKLLDYAAKIAIGGTQEGLTEYSENILHDLNQIALTDPEFKIKWSQAAEEGEIGAYVGGIMQAVINAGLHIRARGQQKAFEDLNDAAKLQKLKERSPESYENFSQAVAQHLATTSNGAITDVYIDANVFRQTLIENKIDPAKVGEAVPSIGAQLNQAFDANETADIVVPMGDWIGKIAGTDIGDMLTPHLRAHSEAVSITELQQATQMAENFSVNAEKIAAQVNGEKEFAQQVRDIENTFRTEFLAKADVYSGKTARIAAKFEAMRYAALANALNMSPAEVFQKFPVQFARETVAGAPVFNQQITNELNKDISWSPERVTQLVNRYAYTMDDKKTKASFTRMTPDQFLGLTTDKEGLERIEKETNEIDFDELARQSQEIFLEVKQNEDGTLDVVGHEGRHRMLALRRAGVTDVPVTLVWGSGAQRDVIAGAKLNPQKFYDDLVASQGTEVGDVIPINYENIQRIQDSQSNAQIFFQPPKDISQHVLMVERGERTTGKVARISEQENAIIDAAVEGSTVKAADVRAAVRQHKLSNPPKDGWAPLVLSKVKIEKGKEGKPDKYEIEYITVPYTFADGTDGKVMKKGSAEYNRRVSAIARKMRDEVFSVYQRALNGDKAAQNIIRQAGWYKEMRSRLRHEFGGLGDLFADLLGATSPNTPVRENWKNAVDILRRASRGDFDEMMPKWVEWSTKVEQAEADLGSWFGEQLEAGFSKKAIKLMPGYVQRVEQLTELRKLPDDLMPLKENGKKYGFNGRNAVRAMLNLWRVVKDPNADLKIGGTAPKALNFSGNLIGFREGATIDVWAARLLQRLSGGIRIPSMAESGVTGNMLSNAETTLQFGFGQDVFNEASKLIRQDPQMNQNETLAKINDDDLQAVVWFLEKEVWTRNDWTSAAGEGGSFEYEADLTGQPDMQRVNELRKIVDSTKSTREQKEKAQQELNKLVRTVDRYVGGLSIQQSADTQGVDFVPTDADMAQLGERMSAAAYADDPDNLVVASKMLATEGRYGGVERSLDMEVVTKAGYNPDPLLYAMIQEAQAADQDSVFLSRVLRETESPDFTKDRPGVEIYFQSAGSIEKVQDILDDLAKQGVEFYTVIVDGKRSPSAMAGEMPPVVGVRFQYVPEMQQRYGLDDFSWESLTVDEISTKIEEQSAALANLASKITAQVEGVSFAGQFWYETEVIFKNQYQEKLNAIASRIDQTKSGKAGAGVWTGQSIREGVENAARWSRESSQQTQGPGVIPSGDQRLNQPGTGTGGIQRLRTSDIAVTANYGTAVDGASQAVGVHYSRSPRSTLSGEFYGTGLKGAESRRLDFSGDPRISNRIHFYVDTGAGIAPEAGVGGNAHAVQLNNLYDISADPLGLMQAAGSVRDDRGTWFNAVESAILDAGFDGVLVPTAQGNQGVAVLLGPQHSSVPVNQIGLHSAPITGAVAAPSSGKMSYSLLTPEIRTYSEQEQAIKEQAPSVQLKNGSLVFDEVDLPAIVQFFPDAAKARQLRQPARGGYDPKSMTVFFSERHDFSTVHHELFHNIMNIYEQIVSSPNPPQQIVSDFETLIRSAGIGSMREWSDLDFEQKRKVHEQLAYQHEIWLFEGKAPSKETQDIFSRISKWMVSVYENIVGQLNSLYKQEFGEDLPALTDEVRSVFDRMVASQKQIQQAENIRNMIAMYQTQEESGMDDQAWEAYQQMIQDATDVASSELTEATLRQLKWLGNARSRILKEMQKGNAELRAKVKAEVEAEVAEEPLYKAMNWLKTGETVDENGAEFKADAGYKLSIEAVKSMYPESRAGLDVVPDYKKLGYGQYGMLAVDGLHPDIVAGMFGIESGDILVRQLVSARKFSDEVEARTDERMMEEHGELSDPKALEIAVERAIHNEARARFVAVELRHLAKAGQPVRVMTEAAKLAARQMIGARQLKTINPRNFAVAESRAAKEAMSHMKKGESNKAVIAKRNQLLNNQLATEALKVKQEVAKALQMFKKVFGNDKKLADSRDMNFVSAARAILANYGLGKTDMPASAYLEQVQKYDPEFYAEIKPMITAASAQQKPFESLTYDEFVDMRDQVEALWHLSRRQRQMEIDGKMVDRDAVVKELTDRIGELSDGKKRAGYDKAMSDWDKRKITLMGARAALRRVESWVDAMDGGKLDGPFRKYIWTPISEAVSKYRLEKNVYMEKYLNIIKSVEKTLDGSSIEAEEIGYSFKNKAELLHAILHTGNLSNKKKLLIGRGWAAEMPDGSLDTSRWDAFLARMYAEGKIVKEDMDFAQSVWDLLEEMKPAAQKAHREMYGFYFSEITAETVDTPFGQYRGGYVPAVVDPWIVVEGQIRSEQETQAMDNSYMFPTTGRGFTQGRVEGYNEPLMLDLGFMPSHIDKVLRFTYVEPRIKDVAKIVKTDRNFAKAIDALDPTIRGDMLMPWMQRTAQQMIMVPMKGFGGKGLEKFFSEVRKRTGMQLMVANITNALQQLTGFSIAMLKVKPKYLRNALWLYIRQPSMTADMVGEKSPFMLTRMSNQQFEISKTIDQLLLNPSKYDKLRDFADKHGYFMQQSLQNLVDTVTWTGAYNENMEKHGNEKMAVRAADAAVRLTQGSFAPEDVSRFESGNAFARAFTMFYSYFNMQANLLGTEFLKTTRDMGVRRGAGRLLYIYTFGFMAPAVLSEMIVQAAGGFDTGDDDEWDQYDAMALFFGSQARTATAMVPVVGPAALAGFNMWNKKPYDDRISTSASISAIEQSLKAPVSLYKAIADDGSWKRAVRDTLTMLGMITGLPLGQLGKPIGYIADVEQGKAKPESAMDYVRGLLSGKDVNRENK
jgi:hypothetical protein